MLTKVEIFVDEHVPKLRVSNYARKMLSTTQSQSNQKYVAKNLEL